MLSSDHDVLVLVGGAEPLLAPLAHADEKKDYEEAGQNAHYP